MSYLDNEVKGFLRATVLMAEDEWEAFLKTDLTKEKSFTFSAIPFLLEFLKTCIQKDHFEFPSFKITEESHDLLDVLKGED